MKKNEQTASVSYAPEKVSEKVEINFTKFINPGKTSVTGSIRKEGTEVGTVSLDTADNYLITSLKPYGTLEPEEVKAVYDAIPGCIAEMLND